MPTSTQTLSSLTLITTQRSWNFYSCAADENTDSQKSEVSKLQLYIFIHSFIYLCIEILLLVVSLHVWN